MQICINRLKTIDLLQISCMDNIKLKSAISRIMSDLVKLDSLITASELEFLDTVYKKYGVSTQDRKMGFYMTLEEAVSIFSSQPERFRREFFTLMKEGSVADGACSRPEAFLLMAFSCACGINPSGKGRVYSFESKGIPLHRDQLIYLSKEDRNERSLLADDELYEDINNIARLSGFELVYVPRIARHFETYQKTDILRKVLTLVRPTLDRSEDELIRQVRTMTSYKFCTNILERKMKMSLKVTSPCWLIKMGNSQVGGMEYSNFLLLEIDYNHMKLQLKQFMSMFLQLQPEYMVSVSPVEEDADNFRYGGFVKSILDMISLGTDERRDVIIRLKGCKTFVDGDGNEQRASISIRRGEEEWPLIGPDRDAAFYALVICYTAEDSNGVRLDKDLEQNCETQRRYEKIYGMMSVRQLSDCPNICFSDMRRPIISRVNLAINPTLKNAKKTKLLSGSKYLTERELYEISKSQKNFFVVLNPSNVQVRSKADRREVERPLKESTLYSSVIQIKENLSLQQSGCESIC